MQCVCGECKQQDIQLVCDVLMCECKRQDMCNVSVVSANNKMYSLSVMC